MPTAASAQSPADIRLVQEKLSDYGVTRAHGVLDAPTRAAIHAYQRDWQLLQTGKISPELIARLRGEHDATRPQWSNVDNQDCRVWNERPSARDSVTWVGACEGGTAAGKGLLQWRWMKNGQTLTFTYEGDYKRGRAEGLGLMTYASGDRYAGQFKNGHRHGLGLFIWTNGARYQGQFKSGLRQGRGRILFASGDIYDGQWDNGRPHGAGVYRPLDGMAEVRRWNRGCSTLHGKHRWLFTSRSACGF